MNLPASALRLGLKCHHPERAEGLFLRGASWDFRSERFSFFSSLKYAAAKPPAEECYVKIPQVPEREDLIHCWIFFRLFVPFYLFCSSFQPSAFQFLSLKVGLA